MIQHDRDTYYRNHVQATKSLTKPLDGTCTDIFTLRQVAMCWTHVDVFKTVGTKPVPGSTKARS